MQMTVLVCFMLCEIQNAHWELSLLNINVRQHLSLWVDGFNVEYQLKGQCKDLEIYWNETHYQH